MRVLVNRSLRLASPHYSYQDWGLAALWVSSPARAVTSRRPALPCIDSDRVCRGHGDVSVVTCWGNPFISALLFCVPWLRGNSNVLRAREPEPAFSAVTGVLVSGVDVRGNSVEVSYDPCMGDKFIVHLLLISVGNAMICYVAERSQLFQGLLLEATNEPRLGMLHLP